MASRSVSTDPIWLGIGSPKPQPRVKQNSMFGHVVDAFDEKTIVKIGEISPYERRLKAKEEAEKKQKEEDEKKTIVEEMSVDAQPSSASVDGCNGGKQDGDSAIEKNGEESQGEDKTDAAKQNRNCQIGLASVKHLDLSDMSTCLVIKGGKIVNDDCSFVGDLLIRDGKILSIEKDIHVPNGVQVVDASKKYIFPGGIDLNTHFDMTYSDCRSLDDFQTGTRAAIYGGTTIIADCVIPEVNQSYLEAYDKLAKKAEKLFCDCVLRVAITWWSEDGEKEIETLVKEKGVNVFLLPASIKFTDAELHKIFLKLKMLQCLLQVHPGCATLFSQKADEVVAEGITGPEGRLLSYPEEIEVLAIYKYITLADQVGLPVYITTVTSRSGAELVAKKRREGKVVFAEVPVASLSVDGSKIFDSDWAIAAGHVTSPPIRTQKNNASYLINLLSNGDLQTVCSDHRSFGTSQRAVGRDDFRLIMPGVAAVQERLEVTWSVAVNSGCMDPSKFVSATSSFSAKLLNLYPRKGRIAVGSDADLVIFDPEEEVGVGSRQTRSDFNVFQDLKLRGRIRGVIKSGSVVLEARDGGEFKVDLKQGMLLSCQPGIDVGFEKLRFKEKAQGSRGPLLREAYNGPVCGSADENSLRAPSHAAGTRSGAEQPFCRPPTRSGGRNMQDTTLSISVEGTYADDPIKCQKLGGYRVNQPPGGRSTQFW